MVKTTLRPTSPEVHTTEPLWKGDKNSPHWKLKWGWDICLPSWEMCSCSREDNCNSLIGCGHSRVFQTNLGKWLQLLSRASESLCTHNLVSVFTTALFTALVSFLKVFYIFGWFSCMYVYALPVFSGLKGQKRPLDSMWTGVPDDC